MLESVDIIMPTWNNPQYLIPAVQSLIQSRPFYPFRLIVVNNGHEGIAPHLTNIPHVKFVQAPENLGWEGGLKYGLSFSDAKFVMFLNDDIFIPRSSHNWLRSMMSRFGYGRVGAVGPSSNCVMGAQNIWSGIQNEMAFVNYLIGFCYLLRREALDDAGGIDDTLPGGDDLDLSIRLRDKGWHLVHDRLAFVYHHGFKTGERVHGGADVAGGWNSIQMSEMTQQALIRKHGFRKWHETLFSVPKTDFGFANDSEGEAIRARIEPGLNVLELGCGGSKTVNSAFGIDQYGAGEEVATTGQVSVADAKGDVCDLDAVFQGREQAFDVIIARHILEHCTDPIRVLAHWRSYLKPDGRLILALPDDMLIDSVPMNPEHRHAFTKESIESFLGSSGYQPKEVFDSGNGISFIAEAVVNAARESSRVDMLKEAVS